MLTDPSVQCFSILTSSDHDKRRKAAAIRWRMYHVPVNTVYIKYITHVQPES